MPLAPGSLKPDKIRLMRKDPTIFLARLMVRAAIASAAWAVESDEGVDQDRVDFIESNVTRLRADYLDAVTRGTLDFGWQAFEKIGTITPEGNFEIVWLKPLLQDLSELVVDKGGEFIGVRQGEVTVDEFSSMLVSMDAECGYLYGASYMANVESAYDAGIRVGKAADVYDKKIAGAHWIIYFPDGNSNFNGALTANDVIAKTLIQKLENSGSMAIPYKTKDILDDLNSQSPGQWVVDLKESSGSGANFDQRLTRADREKVRGFGIPERAVLEGQFGTRAEASEHGNFALTGIELLHTNITRAFNKYVTNYLLRMNYGQEFEDTVYVQPQPLSDSSLEFLRDLYKAVISNPDGFLNEVTSMDLDAIKSRLKVPYVDGVLDPLPAATDPTLPVTQPTAADSAAATTKAVSLNGAQVASLQEIIINAQTMVYPVATAKEICKISFGLEQGQVDALFAAIVPAKPTVAPA